VTEAHDSTERRGRKRLIARLRGSVWADPVKRRRFLRLGAFALAVTILVLVPGYVASQPEFYERYAQYEDEYDTWSESVHAKVSCQTCHVEPGFAPRAGHSAQMLGEFYITLVSRSREPELLSRPTNAACQDCHVDLRTVSPSGDLNIPHSAHVDVLEIDCVQCHDFLVHELSPEGKHTPRMIDCMTCHDGEQAKEACSVCHTEKAAPENHQRDEWVIVHADAQDEMDCVECHGWTDDWCVECHSRRPVSHVERWRSQHRFKVEERRNCEVCHEPDFCIRCHGDVPILNFDPSVTLVE
jgi:hypothetical protein